MEEARVSLPRRTSLPTLPGGTMTIAINSQTKSIADFPPEHLPPSTAARSRDGSGEQPQARLIGPGLPHPASLQARVLPSP